MKQNKRFYESPEMNVVELKSRATLLAGSMTQSSSTEELEEETDNLF